MATRYRYVYKKSKATFTYNTSSITVDNLHPSTSDGDWTYGYDYVYIIKNFTCYAKSVMNSRYDSSSYLSVRGENFTFILNSYVQDYGTEVETGYDEETGEYDYVYRHTIPAGSYFTIGDYYDDNNIHRKYYYYYQPSSSTSYNLSAYNIAEGILYAETQVVIDSWDSWYVDDDGYDQYNGVFSLVSGTVKLVKPSVSYNSYSYTYISSESDGHVVTYHYPRSYTSGNSSYVNQPTLLNSWQFTESDANYAYCPVILPVKETDLNMDPSAIGLDNTSPTAGSIVNAVVTPSSAALDYGTYTYTYQYSINNGSTWTTIGTTTATSKSFTVPSSATQIKVRVQVSDGIGFTSSNYVTSINYSVNKYTTYTSVSGTIKGISPIVCVNGSIKTSVTTKKCIGGAVKS